MIPLILASTLFTSPQFCQELKYELDRAVFITELTQEQADAVFERCRETYMEGA